MCAKYFVEIEMGTNINSLLTPLDRPIKASVSSNEFPQYWKRNPKDNSKLYSDFIIRR